MAAPTDCAKQMDGGRQAASTKGTTKQKKAAENQRASNPRGSPSELLPTQEIALRTDCSLPDFIGVQAGPAQLLVLVLRR